MQDFAVVVHEPDSSQTPTATAAPSLTLQENAEVLSVPLPTAEIEVVKRYKDWCVLSAGRGNGPRVIEEWVVANAAACFQDLVDDNTDTNQKVSPTLANPHNSAYAHTLLLVARHPSFLSQLKHLRVLVHCLVKGYHAPGTQMELSSTMEDKKCKTTARCLQVGPSNSAGHISLMEAYNSQPDSTYMGARQFRRHFLAGGWPVLGNTRDCCSFRGEKFCLAVVGLEFWVDGDMGMERPLRIRVPPVPRLLRVLEKEERFWKERQASTVISNDKSGGDEIPVPLEYQKEKASFDGLEFRVTPAVMIPRRGSVLLVDRVDAFYAQNERDTANLPPRILDLGTGCGNLLLATLKRLRHLNATGLGLDAAKDALDICEQNITSLGMKNFAETIQATFLDLKGIQRDPFDVVLCNPPYIKRSGGRKSMDAVAIEYEPDRALFVDREAPNVHYEDVMKGLFQGSLVKPGSLVVFEVCKENAGAISDLMKSAGLSQLQICRDWKGCIRTVEGIVESGACKARE